MSLDSELTLAGFIAAINDLDSEAIAALGQAHLEIFGSIALSEDARSVAANLVTVGESPRIHDHGLVHHPNAPEDLSRMWRAENEAASAFLDREQSLDIDYYTIADRDRQLLYAHAYEAIQRCAIALSVQELLPEPLSNLLLGPWRQSHGLATNLSGLRADRFIRDLQTKYQNQRQLAATSPDTDQP